LGLDISNDYILAARKKYGDRARFECATANEFEDFEAGTYDLVSAVALLHHLSDQEVRDVCLLAKRALKPQGRFVSFDNCFIPNQNKLAAWLVSKDRGQNVRTPDGYLNLLREYFPDAQVEVRHDLLRVPYTHAICQARA